MNKSIKDIINIFTDGSFFKRNGITYCGYGVYYPNGEYKDISKPFTKEPLTNQRAELYAIYKGIKKVNKKDINVDIKIYTDSEYSINSLTKWIKKWEDNNWKTSNNRVVMNKDLILNINNLMKSHRGEIKFQHVRSHTNNKDFKSINNDIVDRLAKNGALKINKD
jgi:ribonuclease HI